MPPETMQLRDQLLSASPYLSDTVMVNAAEKEAVLPNSIVTEILAENPQSAKAENVLNKLNERTTPPNENEMAQIHANDTVLGAKEKLESKEAYYASQKQQNVNDLVRLFMSDTTLANVNDSIETALAHVSTPGSYYLQAFARYNKGDSTGVLSKLSDVTSDFDLNGYENDVHTGFEDYFNVMLALQMEGKNVSEIDSTQKSVLYDIVQNAHGLVKALARNILIKTDGLIYHEPYLLPDTTTTKSAKVKNDNVVNTDNATERYFKLYPNPANNYLTLEYQIPLNANNVVVEVVAISGIQKEVMRLNTGWGQKIIDLRTYQPGTYFVRLYLNGKIVENKKFVKL